MTEQELKNKIANLLKEYPIEKYPHSMGAYGFMDNGEEFVALYYENGHGQWVTTHSDYNEMMFDPVKDVYGILDKGAKLFHVSNFVHQQCWRETLLQGNECQFIEFYHGRRTYFDYCKNNGINSEYMMKSDNDLQDVDKMFWKNDLKVQKKSNNKLCIKKYQKLNELTFGALEYYLGEQYYQGITPMFTIENKYKDIVVYFSYNDSECVLQVFPNSKTNFKRDLSDWAFSYEDLLFETMNEGKLLYISLETHEEIMYYIHDCGIDELDGNSLSGFKKYLQYINENKIYNKMKPKCKELYIDFCKELKIGTQANQKIKQRVSR